jgi:hypothetical protein
MSIKTDFALQDGDLIVARENDVEPILQNIKAKQDARAWDTADGSMRHVGTVDYVLLEALCNKHGVTLRRFLNDDEVQDRMLKLYFEEFTAFKVHPGRNL